PPLVEELRDAADQLRVALAQLDGALVVLEGPRGLLLEFVELALADGDPRPARAAGARFRQESARLVQGRRLALPRAPNQVADPLVAPVRAVRPLQVTNLVHRAGHDGFVAGAEGQLTQDQPDVQVGRLEAGEPLGQADAFL